MRIEANSGKGILKIAQGMQDSDLTMAHMIGILTPALRSSGADVKDRDVGHLIWEAGIADALKCTAELVTFIITGGNEEGNEQAAAAT